MHHSTQQQIPLHGCDCIVSQGRAEDHADADLHVNKLAKKVIEMLRLPRLGEIISQQYNRNDTKEAFESSPSAELEDPDLDLADLSCNNNVHSFVVSLTNKPYWSASFSQFDMDWRIECVAKSGRILFHLITDSPLNTHMTVIPHISIPACSLSVPLYCKLSPEKPYDLILRHNSTVLDFQFELTLSKRVDVDVMDENADEEPESMHGRPCIATSYNTSSTRATNAWWHYWHGRPLTKQALAELLDIISDPSFVSEDVAPSPYLLEQCDEFFFNCIPTAKLEVRNSDGTKDSLEYHPLEAILEYVLNNEKLMKGWISSSTSEKDQKDHPSASEGWKIYEDHHSTLLTTCGFKLVLGVLWIDKFLGERSRNNSYTSVYITFANFSKEVSCRADSRFLVCTIPPSLNDHKNYIIDKIIIDFFLRLESAQLPPMPVSTTQVQVCGGLHMVKGDHMEKISLGGIVPPNGIRSSFYTSRPKDEFTKTDTAVKLRSVVEAQIKLASMLKMSRAECKQETTATGYTLPRSPFWRLPIFARDFFRRFGICSLHLILLGIIKKYVEEIGILKGAKYRRCINEAMKSIKQWPQHCVPITMKIYRAKKALTMPLTGQMWYTYAHVATAINTKYLTKGELARWSMVMRGLLTIYKTKWTSDEIEQGVLADLILDLQNTIIESFPSTSKTHWNIPNFETLRVLPVQIAFLGPLWCQATDIEEGLNKYSRQCLYVSNHKMAATNIIKMTARRRGILNQKFDKSDDQEMLQDLFPWYDKATTLIKPNPRATVITPSGDVEKREIESATLQSIMKLLDFKPETHKIELMGSYYETLAIDGQEAVAQSTTKSTMKSLLRYSDDIIERVGFLKHVIEISVEISGAFEKRLVAITEEPHLSKFYNGVVEKVLDKRRSVSRVVPIGWANFKLLGIEPIVTDLTNKQRIFVVS